MTTNPVPQPGNSLASHYFDAVYEADADPWRFESSDYEAAKYRATVGALGSRRFASGFEIGCSIGVLTEMLAAFCDRLLAVDISEAPLERARRRCAGLPQVQFARMQVPTTFPAGPFDLVVMSEVGYYWSMADLRHAAEQIDGVLAPGGQWLLVHWTPPVHDYPLRGDEVHDALLEFGAGRGYRVIEAARQPTYRLDLLEKPAPAPTAPDARPASAASAPLPAA